MGKSAKIRTFPVYHEKPIPLPLSGPIYWLQADHEDDEILPPPSAVYKLSCTTICLCRSEIVTRWSDRQHVFVRVKFEGKRRKLLAA